MSKKKHKVQALPATLRTQEKSVFSDWGYGFTTAAHTGTLVLIALFLCGAIPSFGQNESSPDFANVDDILGGRRTLLAVNDLVIGGLILKTDEGTKIPDKNIYSLPDFKKHKAYPEIIARIFDSTYDTLVYAHGSTVYVIDPVSKASKSLTLKEDEFSLAGIAAGDFRGDGSQEVVFASYQGARIVSAVDPKDPSKGIQSGPLSVIDKEGSYKAAVAVGDFDGDGKLEVAVAYDRLYAPEGRLSIYRVNPKSLALELQHVTPVTEVLKSTDTFWASLVAGRFGTTAHDQLLLGYRISTFNGSDPIDAQLRTYDFDNSLKPLPRDTYATGLRDGLELILQAGRFSFDSPYAQVALKWNQRRDDIQLGIISFDTTLKIDYPKLTRLPGISCSSGLAVGSFARTEPVPQNSSETQLSFKLQLAISSSNCNGSIGVNIYNVNPTADGTNFIIDPGAVFASSWTDPSRTQYYGLPIVAGDVQGRSVLVGEPFKVTVSGDRQLDLVLAMPPMHIDYIRPTIDLSHYPKEFPGCEAPQKPCLLNISVLPALGSNGNGRGFNTQYAYSEESSAKSEDKGTTSWTWGVGGSVGGGVTFGSAKTNSISLEASYAGKEEHEGTVANQYNHYSGTSTDIAAATGFADHIFYTDQRFNVWFYPVLGKKACPAANPDNCSEAEKGPLYYELSGPDRISHHESDATNEEWFQPPQEPGNLFSYPWSLSLLEKLNPGLHLATKTPTWRAIDTSINSYSTNWDTNGTAATTTGSANSHENSVDVSVSGTIGTKGTIQGKFESNFNWNNSSSTSTLNNSSTALSASTGIKVLKPSFDNVIANNFTYDFAGLVFSRLPPGDIAQSLVVTEGSGENKKPVGFQTPGPMIVGFMANPFKSKDVPFWAQAYSKPDIGLNHPARWNWSNSEKRATFNARHPNVSPVSQPFYWMKGFLITPEAAAGQGPQLTRATAGDRLRLQARVYNYSLKDTPEGSVIRVRFFGQIYDSGAGQLVGDAFEIKEGNEEVTIPSIPGFLSSEAKANWVLASTIFDTSKFEKTKNGNVKMVFWVVVWMEDANGQLAEEIEGHGLSAKPADVLNQISEVQVEHYSNNVGMYGVHTPFVIAPRAAGLTDADSERPAQLEVEAISVPSLGQATNSTQQSSTLSLGRAEITVLLTRVGAGSFPNGSVTFYDGDPEQGGKPFDVEHVNALETDSSYLVRSYFQPESVGPHTIFAVAEDGVGKTVTASYAVFVAQ